MIVDETLRFVPPARITNRQAVAEDEVSGYRIPAGAVVAVSPYVLHRMPAWWPDTERFDPQRFAPDAEQERPRFAHMPFGGDPHPCISSIGLVGADAPVIGVLLTGLGLCGIPIAIGIAILRYRLYDIDVIIRKTLVYSVLTVLLGLIYFGSVVLLQIVFGRLAGVEQSTLAVVISTLAIAALFTPLRRRIQDVIDRRFFRQKYDAQQVLARFVQTACDETDLDVLTARLLLQVFQISQILKSSRRLFVRLQVRQVNEIHCNTIDFNDDPVSVALAELDARQRRQQIDAVWRIPELDDLIRHQKVLWLQPYGPKAKLPKRFDHVNGVVTIQPEPDVQILGVARVAVERHRVAANNQITDAVIV